MLDIRKIVALRDITYSELAHKPARPIVRAVGMAVIHNPCAGNYAEDLRQLWEAGAGPGERLTPELVKCSTPRPSPMARARSSECKARWSMEARAATSCSASRCTPRSAAARR